MPLLPLRSHLTPVLNPSGIRSEYGGMHFAIASPSVIRRREDEVCKRKTRSFALSSHSLYAPYLLLRRSCIRAILRRGPIRVSPPLLQPCLTPLQRSRHRVKRTGLRGQRDPRTTRRCPTTRSH